jgi:hypothetical protein
MTRVLTPSKQCRKVQVDLSHKLPSLGNERFTMAFRTLIALLLVVAAVSAFVPIANRHQTASKGTQLQFGFLKELGLEKPSWLPDFGGKKEEEDTTNHAPVATADDGDDAPAAEDDAPKED